jgi:hypothetical protein
MNPIICNLLIINIICILSLVYNMNSLPIQFVKIERTAKNNTCKSVKINEILFLSIPVEAEVDVDVKVEADSDY